MASITHYLYYRETPEVAEKAKEMQAKYPELKECAALVKLGLTAADTVRACYTICHIYVYGSMFTNSLELVLCSLVMCSLKFSCIFFTLQGLQLYGKDRYYIYIKPIKP